MTAIEQQWSRSSHRAHVACDVPAPAVSSGGPKALNTLLAGLPDDFPASVLVVQRLCREQRSLPIVILSRRRALGVKQTVDGDMLRPAPFHTAVPDPHLLVRPDGTVSQATRVRFVRAQRDVFRALGKLAAALGGW